MFYKNIPTPFIFLDLDIMNRNLERVHGLAKKYNKEVWPMIKTHKSSELLEYQRKFGSSGVLCGTLDECEAACTLGFENIMYAYPVSDSIAIDRVISLAKRCNFIIRIDNLTSARIIDSFCNDIKINYTVIINTGLDRFGIDKDSILDFVLAMEEFKNLNFVGISSHPGQVYGMKNRDQVGFCSNVEMDIMRFCYMKLRKANYDVRYVSTGSTPTFFDSVSCDVINIFHPGNYIFNDFIQVSLGVSNTDDCALKVQASIISNPRAGVYIMDAGAKTLGLDMGAHGNDLIKGHGFIVDHKDALIYSLSEEVGKIKSIQGEFKVGERIDIIPNHSCSTANLTSYIYGLRNNQVEKVINVDIRENSKLYK